MSSRRDFIKKAGLLAGGAPLLSSLPASIRKAISINPELGSTFYDAEHVVLLMQENRSFDHCFGTLKGVRGFNDPRAVRLPDGNPVWLQSSKAGESYAPFRLDIKDTKATWMSSLPHSWTSQVDARNGGRHDQWLEAKRSGNKAYANMPLTLGYYQREDIPFYYALADAFTVCDQHFCSSLTGTTPNRLYYLTGTIREEQSGDSPANVDNSNVDYNNSASWKTFPERLEENGISWKVYQNELSVGVGFKGEEDSWLANFTDNPLEWFSQYHVRFLPAHVQYLQKAALSLSEEIRELKDKRVAGSDEELSNKQALLEDINKSLLKFNENNFDKLPEEEQHLHKKGFVTNVNDPHYHQLETLTYKDGEADREMKVPKGDVLHQFRADVENGNLPMVSWLMAPENFSDHPGAPWYGAWYVSEVMDILTKHPEVWKKTIFILTYDENDGYFDHIPPFVPPDPTDPRTGKCSKGIDTTVDYVTAEQAQALNGKPKDPKRVSPVGLGYRVPFIVASPWSRGGFVNSQVFDNTSVLMFLEKFLTKKTGKQIRENNISSWRRTICGDLTSVFQQYHGEKIELPEFVEKQPFVESIYNAQFKRLPNDFKALDKHQVKMAKSNPGASSILPRQEKGIRPSRALPYEIYAAGNLSDDKKAFIVELSAGKGIFGDEAAGVPFTIYDMQTFEIRNYAVSAGDHLSDDWPLVDKGYHLRVYGPNGFFREFTGDTRAPGVEVSCVYEKAVAGQRKLSGNLEIHLHNKDQEKTQEIQLVAKPYNKKALIRKLPAQSNQIITLPLKDSFGWYDLSIKVKGHNFTQRFAGRVETGRNSFSDPVMGNA